MTLLVMIQQTAERLNLPKPDTVIGNSDPQVRNLLALANEEGKKIAQRGQWQQLITQALFSSDLGSLTSDSQAMEFDLEQIAPGWDFQLNSTFWDRSGQNLVNGPITPQQYQTDVAYLPMNVYYEWRVAGDKMVLYPPPPQGDDAIELAFEYLTRYWCKSPEGTLQDEWKNDSDTGLIDEDLMSFGIEWRRKRARGYAGWQSLEAEYEALVTARIARGVTGAAIDITGRDMVRQQRVPWGNWPGYS